MHKSIEIFDSTLRDGVQGTGITFSLEDKLSVVRLLDSLGVAYIEAGNPASNPKDSSFFREASALRLSHSRLTAFGSTRRKQIKAEEDQGLLALLKTGAEFCTVFGKASKFHVKNVIETDEAENLNMVEESCRFLCENGRQVFFDAEHFFDGYKEDADYAMEVLRAAARGGARLICLCDTNGGTFPTEAAEITGAVCAELQKPVAVHFHNDCGMAVANSVIAAQSDISQVQGTFLGFGERCGNANLSAVIADLQLKLGITCIPQENLKNLTQTARKLDALMNLDYSDNLPYVGKNAFSHKAGMHAAAVLKTPRSFEHIDPALVGNKRVFPASEISGKAIVFERLKELFPELKLGSREVVELLEEIKELELKGYQFEGADASFELLVRKKLKPFKSFFELIYYKINTDFYDGKNKGASAVVKVRVGDRVELTAAEGNGPVNALDSALRKALEIFYPQLSKVKLTDYKVRVLDSQNATAAGVRVLITSSDGVGKITTVGVSSDVVAASWRALKDSMDFILLHSI